MLRLKFVDEEDLRQLQNLSTPVWIFDVDGHGIWWANTQGLAFWKASSAHDIRQRDFSSDSATVRQRLRQIVELATEDTRVVDTWTLYPQGDPQPVKLSFQPIEVENKFRGILIELVQVVTRDTGDDMWRLLEAARATSLIMTTFSMEGRILAQNPASLACYGASSEKLDGTSDLAARFREKHVSDEVIKKAISNEEMVLETEVFTARGLRTHSLSVHKGRDPVTGDFVVVLNEEDVTELAKLRELQESEKETLKQEVIQSYEKLRISQQRYELAVRTAAIWDWDATSDKLFMSPNFANALEYTSKEFQDILRAQTLSGFLYPDDVDAYQAKLSEHLNNPTQPLSHELRFLTKSGDVLWFHCQGQCVCDEEGNVSRSAGLLTDVTHRKQLETTLLASQRMEAVGQLTGGIAHDFNNLLTIIQGNAELLVEMEQEHSDLVGEIISAVRRGADLTRHLLAFAGRQTLIPNSVNLNDLIPEMQRTLLRVISETVEINFLSSDELWYVHADQTQLETAILNLALNARDAMPWGGTLTISCKNKPVDEIESDAELELTDNDYVEISVADNGEGMSKENLSKAFEPFFTTKGVGQGSGLGLSMVRGFCRQSCGDAVIQSERGRGTTISIYLPRSNGSAGTKVVARKTDAALGNQEHIHILEDNKHVQQAVSKLVRSLGYEVTTSNDAMHAMGWVNKNPQADLYLVDVLLPGGKSGVDFAQSLKCKYPNARILFMSGYSENELEAKESLSVGTGFVSKPFDKASLRDAIRTALVSEQSLEPAVSI
ncbi:MAG: ATP-binding protein [Litoreibacter sp.]